MKICSQCNLELPKTSFNKRSASVDGLMYQCKDCQKKYRAVNKERIKSQKAEAYVVNREKILLQKSQYYIENSEDIKETRKNYCINNPEKVKKVNHLYYKTNADKVKTSSKAYYELKKSDPEYRQKRLEYSRLHAKANPAMYNATCAKRRARKLNATPPWADLDQIKLVYTECKEIEAATGTPHHVDHIVPLINDRVCGLHVPFNLRVIPAVENLSKGNYYWPHM